MIRRTLTLIVLILCSYGWIISMTCLEYVRRDAEIIIKPIYRSPAERASFYDQMMQEEQKYTMLEE